MADALNKQITVEKHSFAKNVISSFIANIMFASLLGGGLYLGYKKKWFKIEE